MFAVIKTGGKQYKVAAGDVITAMTLPGSPGDTIAFDHVLMLVREGHTDIGAPYVAGATRPCAISASRTLSCAFRLSM